MADDVIADGKVKSRMLLCFDDSALARIINRAVTTMVAWNAFLAEYGVIQIIHSCLFTSVDCARCLVCELCRSTVVWVDCRRFSVFFLYSLAGPGVCVFLRVAPSL